MRVSNSVHFSHPWRMRAIAADFTVEDVWDLPVHGRAGDFEALLETFASIDMMGVDSLPARALWQLRHYLGRWFHLDAPSPPDGAEVRGSAERLPIPGCTETSLAERLPEDLRGSVDAPGFRTLPFSPIYLTDSEYAAELSNRTVHAAIHLGWVERGGGLFQGQMAVYVKPRGEFGRAYMALIRPFRYWIVYPALMRAIERTWNARSGEQSLADLAAKTGCPLPSADGPAAGSGGDGLPRKPVARRIIEVPH